MLPQAVAAVRWGHAGLPPPASFAAPRGTLWCQRESTTTEGETTSRDERRRRRDREPPLGSGTPRPSAMRHLAWGGAHHRRGVGGRGGRRRWTEEPGDGGSPYVTGRSAIGGRRGFFLLIWTQPEREREALGAQFESGRLGGSHIFHLGRVDGASSVEPGR